MITSRRTGTGQILEQVFYPAGVEDDERLYAAPLNSVRPPVGKDRKGGHASRVLVLVRLIWPRHTEIVPAVLVWANRFHDRVCVEWSPSGKSGPTRMTWLRREDVKPRLRY